jgi:hypothetical protein
VRAGMWLGVEVGALRGGTGVELHPEIARIARYRPLGLPLPKTSSGTNGNYF